MSSRTRVLWVSHTGTWVGPTNSLALLLEHLHERVDSAVLLTEPGAFTDLLRERGVASWSLRSLGRRAIPSMIRLVRQGRFDLVYTNNTSSASANAIVAATLAGTPTVTHIRSVWARGGWWRSQVFGRTLAQVAVSRSVARAFVRYVPTARPHVVYNGVPAPPSDVDPESARVELRAELSLPTDALLILHLAHVMPRKGQTDAVEAMARVAARFPEAYLLLVGRLDRDAGYAAAVRARSEELGIADRVLCLGFRRDVDRICAACDIQLHTAHVDPHPRAVIEGMAAGLPTVAAGVDGVAETVLDGETGLLFERGDTQGLAEGMTRLVERNDVRTLMGERARERARREFTAETVLEGETGLLFERGDTVGLAEGMTRLVERNDVRTLMGERARERARREFTAEGTAKQVGDIIEAVLSKSAGRPAHAASIP